MQRVLFFVLTLMADIYADSACCRFVCVCVCVCVIGAGEPDEDELYESGVLDSTGVYRLQGEKLVPHEEAWASIPSVSLLDSKEVTPPSLRCRVRTVMENLGKSWNFKMVISRPGKVMEKT